MPETLRVLELFSGIGGMRASCLAVEKDTSRIEVVNHIDINPNANTAYSFNWGKATALSVDISTLECIPSADLWMMSPPCQPHTRQGNQKDDLDSRSSAFLAILSRLRQIEVSPEFILLENVKQFSSSNSCDLLKATLDDLQYDYRQFVLTPTQFGIPNERPRYYMLARKTPFIDEFNRNDLLAHIPGHSAFKFPYPVYHTDKNHEDTIVLCDTVSPEPSGDTLSSTPPISSFLDCDFPESSFVPRKVLSRPSSYCFDVVSGESKRSCCFTKSYSRFIRGTGSVLSTSEHIDPLQRNLRYFTPTEVLRLMGFPDFYTFPSDMSLKQQYALLGNSVSVTVVSALLAHLLEGVYLAKK